MHLSHPRAILSAANPSAGGPQDDWLADHTTQTIHGEKVLEYKLTYDEQGTFTHKEAALFGDNAVSWFCDVVEYDEQGRLEHTGCECPEPCWKWTYTDTYYEWDCPEDTP